MGDRDVIMTFLVRTVRPICTYEAEMMKRGRGRLYLLSDRMVFDAWGKGVTLEAPFDDIVKFRFEIPNWFFMTVRRRWGHKTFAFSMCQSKLGLPTPRSVEIDLQSTINDYQNMISMHQGSKKKGFWKRHRIDIDAHWESEAIWFECNWHRILRFLKPQSAKYLKDFVENVRIGSPAVNPYLLVAKFDNLTYDDFSDLPGFLNWRYCEMTEREIDMAVSLFRDYKRFNIATLELEIDIQSRLKNYQKLGRSLFEHVILVSRKIEEYSAGQEEEQISKIPWTHVQYYPLAKHCNLQEFVGSS